MSGGDQTDLNNDPQRSDAPPKEGESPGGDMKAALLGDQRAGTDDPADQKDHRAKEREHWARTNKIASALNWITLVAAVASLLGLGILYGTLQQTRKQAEAAIKSNEAAIDALHQSQRPWVTVSAEDIQSADVSTQRGFVVRFPLIVKNSGNSIAISAFVKAFPYREGDIFPNLQVPCREADKEMASMNETFKEPTGFIVAPGGEIKRSIIAQALTQLDKPLPHPIDLAPYNGSFSFYILGCVSYMDQFNLPRPHHTRFCYQPRRTVVLTSHPGGGLDGQTDLFFCSQYQKAD